MASESAQNYLLDFGHLVREYAEQAKANARQRARSGTEVEQAFASGVAMAYYEVTSLMKSQAENFEIPLEDVGFGGFDPEGLLDYLK